ncbi:MAG: zinc metalloprotease HtpX [Fimbriimonadaceae bacterium]|nr:zinc metalloprotease HtpX [Fimbriimonadaceae bacterium]
MMNTVKVGILLVALTAILVLIGRALGGATGAIIALGLAIVLNLGSFWFSDKLVVKMTKARPVSPEQAPELHAMVERLSARAGIPKPGLYVVDDPTPNAFATGRSPERGIVAVNTGLLQILDQPEVEGVIAHELAHIRHRDTLTMAVVATVAGAVMLLADFMRIFAIFGGGDEDGMNPLALIVMSIVAPFAAIIIQLAISRAREYEADRLGAEIAGSPHGLANALRKLESTAGKLPTRASATTAHLYIINPFGMRGGISSLFRTHPTTEDRISRLMALSR